MNKITAPQIFGAITLIGFVGGSGVLMIGGLALLMLSIH